MLVIGVRLMRGAEAGRWLRAVLLATLGIILIGTGLALLFGGAVNGLPAGWGGAFGLSFASLVEIGIALIGEPAIARSEEHTSELQSLMRISYAVFCLKNKNRKKNKYRSYTSIQ